MKYSSEFEEVFAKKPVFSAREAKLFLRKRGASAGYARLFLHKLAKKKSHRISKGVYSFRQEMQVVGMAYEPYYYGLQDALSLHNAWEQETNPVVITPRKVRVGTKKFLGQNYWVRKISRKMFFGYETVRYDDFWINVSDLEKTLIDFAYFKLPLPKETVGEIKERLQEKRLQEYLRRCPAWVRKRVQKILGTHA